MTTFIMISDEFNLELVRRGTIVQVRRHIVLSIVRDNYYFFKVNPVGHLGF